MPELRRITTYPIKALDPLEKPRGTIGEGGIIDDDRRYAILAQSAEEPYDPRTESASRGRYINGKRTDAVHRLRAKIDPGGAIVTFRVQDEEETHSFDLANDRSAVNAWLSAYFGESASVRRYASGGHHDLHSHDISGPSIISTATLREVASWFPDLSVDNVRRRFRANLEIDGCPPFWEDRLVADQGDTVAFRVGDVRFEGVEPCARCVVVTRDPMTGEEYDGFRETFVQNRRRTRPSWSDSDRFDHDFRLMTITNVPNSEWGKEVSMGDSVEIL